MVENKQMFVIGIILILATAAIFLFVENDVGISPMVLGIIGITMIGASNYKPLQKVKKKLV